MSPHQAVDIHRRGFKVSAPPIRYPNVPNSAANGQSGTCQGTWKLSAGVARLHPFGPKGKGGGCFPSYTDLDLTHPKGSYTLPPLNVVASSRPVEKDSLQTRRAHSLSGVSHHVFFFFFLVVPPCCFLRLQMSWKHPFPLYFHRPSRPR